MTTNIGEPNIPYADVQIPTLEDAADIRAALRIYHYGSDSADPDLESEEFLNSVAGEILAISNSKRDISISAIPLSTNLNEITSPGVYYASLSAASGGSNFPLISGTARAGFLFVESWGEINKLVVQKYVTLDNSASFNSVVFFRTKAETWSPATWTRLSDSSHNHDERYIQTILLRPELDGKPNQVNGKNASGVDLTGTRKIIVAAPVEVGGVQVPNITPAQQASLQPGDIWFW